MPKIKNTEKTKNSGKKKNILSEIKWGESYISLILGAIVVFIAVMLIIFVVKNKNFNGTKDTASTSELKTVKMYEVKEGEDLWSISEKLYGSGYNWVDLAEVNKLDNPSLIYVGTKLAIPEVKPKVIIAEANKDQKVSIKTDSYTVVEDDNLWEIAVRAYGDGYKWVEIAKANNLENPDLIFAGNTLKLPRAS